MMAIDIPTRYVEMPLTELPYNQLSTMHNAQCTMHNAQCTMFISCFTMPLHLNVN